MTYIPRVTFYDLSRFTPVESSSPAETADQDTIKVKLSDKFGVPEDKIEVDLNNLMSIIHHG